MSRRFGILPRFACVQALRAHATTKPRRGLRQPQYETEQIET